MTTVWHMTTKERGAPAHTEHRHVFDTPEKAWEAYKRAIQADFEANVEEVVRVKAATS